MLALSDTCRRFADECEERARRAPDGSYARSLFHTAARQARDAIAMHRLGNEGLRLALDSAMSTARFAAYLTGEAYDAPTLPASAPPASDSAADGVQCPADALAPAGESYRPMSSTALPTCRLAKLHGMTERGARKRIVAAYDRGAQGTYHVGGKWFAEPAAFAEKFRMSSAA